MKAELGILPAKSSSITIDFSTIAAATKATSLATETAVSAATAGEASAEACTTLDAAVFVLVCSCFLALSSDHFDIAQQLAQFSRAVPYVDALIFAVLIDVVELS